jgi:Tfp pilus assembly protein PilF
VTASSNGSSRAGFAALALVALIAARPAGGADESLDAAMARLDRGDLAGATALAQAWCERAPDDANGWLALGCCEAFAKEWPAAVNSFSRASRAGEGGGEVALRSRFDLAKALFEQARATPLPAAPEHGTPAPSEVADARTRLAIVRLELESARDALIAVLDAAPTDVEARRGLAAATARLREVVALDAKWRAKSSPPNEAARGEGAPARGPLKRGPSGTKSSAGASGKRAGESSDGANGAAPGTTGGDAPSGIGAAPLRPDEEQRLADELKRAFEERARSDARRADARARLRGVQN